MKKQRLLAIFLLSVIVIGGFVAVVKIAEASPANCLILKTSLTRGSSDRVGTNTVTKLQDFLRDEGYLKSESTGYFGTLTFKAVKDFQTSQGISSIGVVGPMTRKAIEKISCAEPVVVIPTPAPVVSPAEVQVATVITAVTPVSSDPKLPYEANPFYKPNAFSGWKTTWGNVSNTADGTLYLKSMQERSGAEVIFGEGINWTDYRYTAQLTVSNGDITLMARYKDKDNFLACTFAENAISIRERRNGVTNTLVSGKIEGMPQAIYFAMSTSMSIEVSGKTIGCRALGSINNVSYTIDDLPLTKGGIGVQTFGVGLATLELRAVNVEAI